MPAAKIKKQQEPEKTDKITFKCNFCEEEKPLNEMRILNRFFPPVVACRDCEKLRR